MKKFSIMLGLLLVAALALTACGGGGGGGKEVVWNVKAGDDFTFNPNTFTASKGDTLKVVLDNSGNTQVHNVVISELGLNVKAQPGQTAEGTVKLDKTGTFEVVCSEPGHKEGGMTATLTVN